jgi:glycosyltransferase involved in cell wall biosynthesis
MDKASAQALVLARPPTPELRKLLLEQRLAVQQRFLNLRYTGPDAGLPSTLSGAQDMVRRLADSRPHVAVAIFGQPRVMKGLLSAAPEESLLDLLPGILSGLSSTTGVTPASPLELRLAGRWWSDPLRRIILLTDGLDRLILDATGLHIHFRLLEASGPPEAGAGVVDFASGSRAPAGSPTGARIVSFDAAALAKGQPFIVSTRKDLPLSSRPEGGSDPIWAALKEGFQLVTRWQGAWQTWCAALERIEVHPADSALPAPAPGVADVHEEANALAQAEALLVAERRSLLHGLAGTHPLTPGSPEAGSELADLAALAALVQFQDWFARSNGPGSDAPEFRARRQENQRRLREGWTEAEAGGNRTELGEGLLGEAAEVVRSCGPLVRRRAPVSSGAAGQRALLINIDPRDFIYSWFFGNAVQKACARRRIPVDVLSANPFAGRDIGGELGMPRTAFDVTADGAIRYVDDENLDRAKAALDRLLGREPYSLVIVNCEAPLFMHLVRDRWPALWAARWLIYDRHLHEGLGQRVDDPEVPPRVTSAGMHVFALNETPATLERLKAEGTVMDAGATVRKLLRLGFAPQRIHPQAWPVDDEFFRPPPSVASSSEFVVFSGGDSWRDYETLFEAVRGLPIKVRLVTANRWPSIPDNVALLPRLAFHAFRDEVLRASAIVVPVVKQPPASVTTGHPPAAGITVVAMARMLGRTVIASDSANTRQHIPIDGEGGILVPPGDAGALRQALTRLIENPSECERLGKTAREQAASELSLTGFVDRMLACAEKPLDGTPARLRDAHELSSEPTLPTGPVDRP